MADLATMTCIPCQVGGESLDQDKIEEKHAQVPDWDIIEVDGIKRLQRTFSFDDFKEALSFTNEVGEMAEEQDHHPKLVTEWGSVEVTWWTHKIGGLHQNDFIAAAKTDRLYEPY